MSDSAPPRDRFDALCAALPLRPIQSEAQFYRAAAFAKPLHAAGRPDEADYLQSLLTLMEAFRGGEVNLDRLALPPAVDYTVAVAGLDLVLGRPARRAVRPVAWEPGLPDAFHPERYQQAGGVVVELDTDDTSVFPEAARLVYTGTLGAGETRDVKLSQLRWYATDQLRDHGPAVPR